MKKLAVILLLIARPSVVLHCRTKEGQLPARQSPERSRRGVGGFLIFFSLFTILYSLFPNNAFAQTACSYPKTTAQLTKITSLPYTYIFRRFVPLGVTTTIFNQALEVPINFAQLPAIFAGPNSNFLESRYQDPLHNTAATSNLDSSSFNAFHGPAQKAAPAYLIDDLKIKFIQYLAKTPTQDENSDTYTDVNGQNPRRTADLIAAYGGDPLPPSHGGNQTSWITAWGLYWDKIPTAVNEYYYAFFVFLPPFEGQKEFTKFEAKPDCPVWDRTVWFILPNYYRTTSTSNQINQLLVPKAAQSSSANFTDTTIFASRDQELSKFSKILGQFGESISQVFKKVLKISLKSLNPVKDTLAQNAACNQSGMEKDLVTGICKPIEKFDQCSRSLPIQPNQNPGEGPFCSFPELIGGDPNKPQVPWEQYFPNKERTFMQVFDPLFLNNRELYIQRRNTGMPDEPNYYTNDTCQGNSSSNNLDGGRYVDCTFRRTYIRTLRTPFDPRGLDPLWDYCEPRIEIDEFGNGALVGYDCQLTVNIYLVYYVPWLAPIWNNTTQSDQSEVTEKIVYGSNQVTNRPGSYNLFTPKSVEGTIFPDVTGKKLPSQEEDLSVAPKQRFFGAVDNFKKFVRDCALKPKALQDALGVNCQGEVASGAGTTRPPTIIGDPIPGPGGDGSYGGIDGYDGSYDGYGYSDVDPVPVDGSYEGYAGGDGYGIDGGYSGDAGYSGDGLYGGANEGYAGGDGYGIDGGYSGDGLYGGDYEGYAGGDGYGGAEGYGFDGYAGEGYAGGDGYGGAEGYGFDGYAGGGDGYAGGGEGYAGGDGYGGAEGYGGEGYSGEGYGGGEGYDGGYI